MRDVTAIADPKLDIWHYVDGVDLDELGLSSVTDVNYVYRDANERFDQVLIGTDRFNAHLVIVVDRELQIVLGHHVLDLNEQFANRGEHMPDVP